MSPHQTSVHWTSVPHGRVPIREARLALQARVSRMTVSPPDPPLHLEADRGGIQVRGAEVLQGGMTGMIDMVNPVEIAVEGSTRDVGARIL